MLTPHIHDPMNQYHLLNPAIYIINSPKRIDPKNKIIVRKKDIKGRKRQREHTKTKISKFLWMSEVNIKIYFDSFAMSSNFVPTVTKFYMFSKLI